MSNASAAFPIGHTTTSSEPSPEVDGLGWLASGAGFLALTGAVLLPWLAAIVLGAVAAVIGFGVLGFAMADRGPGIGHGISGIVTSFVALLVASSSAVLPELGVALIRGDSSRSDPVVFPASGGSSGESEPSTSTGQQEVVLTPVVVVASGTAPDSQDAAGNVVTFGAANAVDGDPTTAWRVPGDGIGEYLQLAFDRPVHVDSIVMIPGYAKVDPVDGTDRFTENRRVSSAQFEFSDGQVMSFSYADQPQPQVADIGMETAKVTMLITATTSAAQRDFTAVSELQVRGWAVR